MKRNDGDGGGHRGGTDGGAPSCRALPDEQQGRKGGGGGGDGGGGGGDGDGDGYKG